MNTHLNPPFFAISLSLYISVTSPKKFTDTEFFPNNKKIKKVTDIIDRRVVVRL